MGQQSSSRQERIETKADGAYVCSGRRQKPLVFREGLRVDSNIVDDSDYLFYHLFRMLESIASRLQRSSSPRQIPKKSAETSPLPSARLERTDSSGENIRQVGRVNIVLLQNGKLAPSNSRAEFEQLLADYQDKTGFKSKIRFGEIRILAIECVQSFLQNGPDAAYPIELIRNYVAYPTQYYYNYRPCPQSILPISVARALGWQQSWFRLPGTFLHLNEWAYLLDAGLPLFEVAHGVLLQDGKTSPQKSFSWHLANSFERDKSGATLTALVIQRSIARTTGLSNLLVNDTLSRILLVTEGIAANATQSKLNLQQQISSATR